MKAVVKDIINSPIAAFHTEGLELFKHLETSYQKHEKVEISFVGIDRCATQFLNASLGKMYMQYDPQVVDDLISFNYGIVTNLQERIKEVRENAIHSKEYDNLVSKASC